MMWLALILVTQSNGDTLRWYDTTTVGYGAVGFTAETYFHWAITLPIDSIYDGRTVHSGRVHIWEAFDSSGIMRLCRGGYLHIDSVLDSGDFHSTGYGFYEVFFGDSIVIHGGDTIWIWCTQWQREGQYPATNDAGPCEWDYGALFSPDGGITWENVCNLPEPTQVHWVMELVLTLQEVEEGPLPGLPEDLTLQMALEGFLISGYEGPVQVYDATGRLLLSREIKGKTLIGPLSPGVYFVVGGRQRAKVAVR